jgi:hypothetical protein
MCVLLAEDISRDDKDVVGYCLFGKVHSVIARRFDKGVERPCRLGDFKFIFQTVLNHVAFFPVVVDV